jgi:hypothetical protein
MQPYRASLFSGAHVSYDDFAWAFSMVRSRAFGEFRIAPYLDLPNHHHASTMGATLSADGTTYYLDADRSFQAGEEVEIPSPPPL